MLRPVVAALAVVLIAFGCGAPKTPASLTITTTPNAIDGLGQVSTVSLNALDENDMAGTGSVSLVTTAGSLKTEQMVKLDVNGYGEIAFHCEVATDPDCMGSIQVKGTWARAGHETVVSYGHVTVGTGSSGGGAGGGGGTGGGTGGDGGSELPKCAPGRTPGVDGVCCQNIPASITGPPCGGVQGKDGKIFMAPFTTKDGGMVDFPVVFTVGTHYADLAACNSWASGFVVDFGDGGTRELNTAFTLGVVTSTGAWQNRSLGNTGGSIVMSDSMACMEEFPSSGTGALGDYGVAVPFFDSSNSFTVGGETYQPIKPPNSNVDWGYWWVNVK